MLESPDRKSDLIGDKGACPVKGLDNQPSLLVILPVTLVRHRMHCLDRAVLIRAYYFRTAGHW